MIKKICKLFYIMDMFDLIINKKQLFISKGGPWGGASINIYLLNLFIKGSLVANFRYTNFWVAGQE